jgi:hypothetical protein
MNDLVFQRLLALLQTAVSEKPSDDSLFAGMHEEDWEILYRKAVEEGVIAFAFDGILSLPASLHPPKRLKLSWAASVDFVERKYARLLSVAQDLAGLFGKHGVRMLIIKGLSLAQYYPVPTHREFGDLDIYLFDHHEKGDQLLKEAGAVPSNHNSYKHTVFTYKGVLIENHAHLLNVRDSGKRLKLEEYLLQLLKENKEGDAHPGEVLFPPPCFAALFFIAHAFQHFSADALVLRAFCDWAVFLRTNKDKIAFPVFRETLEKAGLWSFAVGLTVVSGEWIALPDMLPIGNDSYMETWLRSDKPYPLCHAKSAYGVFVYKLKRFCYLYKRRRKLFGQSLMKYIGTSLIYHFKYPETILRTK